jgi:hypothetical protein
MNMNEQNFWKVYEDMMSGFNSAPVFTVNNSKGKKTTNPYAIKSVLSNHKKNAFTVVWEDGTTTVVHCHECDEWDDEKALAMCFAKKALGNKGNFNNAFNDALLNKMKVVYSDEEKTVINEKMSLKKLAKKVKEAENALNEYTKGAKIYNDTFRGVPAPVDDEATVRAETSAEPSKFYTLYLKDALSGAIISIIGTATNNEQLHKRITEYAHNTGLGLYLRYWASDEGLYVDYGSHTTYMFVPGMTLKEFSLE